MTPRLPASRIQQAVLAWASEMLGSGLSLNASAYMKWAREQAPPAPSISTVLSRLGERTWASLVLSYRDDCAALAPADADAELPFRCRAVGVRWDRAEVHAWIRCQACTCSACKAPSIADCYPEIVGRLPDAGDQHRPVSARVRWRCAVVPDHHATTLATADEVAATGGRCKPCLAAEALYARHDAGAALPPGKGWRPTCAIDIPVASALRREVPDLDVRLGGSVLLRRGEWWQGSPLVQPSMVLPGLRVAIDLASADPPWHHLLDGVGWRVIAARAVDVDDAVSSVARGLGPWVA